MAKEKKIVKKTVDLTGKKKEKGGAIHESPVLKKKKPVKVLAKKDIKKLNEKIAKKRVRHTVRGVRSGHLGGVTSLHKTKTKKTKGDKKYELSIDARDLLKAGCHLGHKKSKTHPKAQDSIYMIRNGVAVFDLPRSLKLLEKACNFVRGEVRKGKKMVMVGTKRQAREVVKRVAVELDLPYVTERWLGGTVSNWDQIKKNIAKLNDLKKGMEEGKFAQNTKKEQSMMKKEIIRLERIVGGLSKLDKLFDILFVVDAGFEKTAVREARGKGITIVGMVDTDTDPNIVDWPIPLNDDSVKSVTIVVEELGKAIK